MNRFVSSLFAVLLVFLAVTPAKALTYKFEFSSNFNTVEGIIEGLVDNTANQAATNVVITSNTGGYGLGTYFPPTATVFQNDWTIVNEVITDAIFLAAQDIPGLDPILTLTTSANPGDTQLIQLNLAMFSDVLSVTGSIFTLIPDVPQIPLPAPLILLLTALAGLGGYGWKTRCA